ncbi:lasso peptide biosynthesis B2 protein [Erythrobacter sp. HA6-11]
MLLSARNYAPNTRSAKSNASNLSIDLRKSWLTLALRNSRDIKLTHPSDDGRSPGEPDSRVAVSHLRFQTTREIANLLRAEWLIRFRSLASWQHGLGVVKSSGLELMEGSLSADESALLCAKQCAKRVERAAFRLPYEPRCLPRAMALQWSLRRHGIPSRLVVAMRKRDRLISEVEIAQLLEDEDRFHAWVELGDAMLIGHCERSEYRPIFAFDLLPIIDPAAGGAQS